MFDFWTWRKPFRSIKFAFQRMKKGYCDYDTWDIGDYLNKTIPKMLKQQSKESIAYPINEDPDQWSIQLYHIANLLEEATKLDEEDVWNNDNFDETMKQMKDNARKANELREKAFKWILENWYNLSW